MTQHPVLNFNYDASVKDFAVSNNVYLAAHPDVSFTYIATSTLVIINQLASQPRILLIQRAAKDSNPNLWEPPGGACDDEDESILHGAIRELQEEAGLQAAHISGSIGEPHFFTTRAGKKVCRFNFAVRLGNAAGTEPKVKLDPDEHQNFIWVTEHEIKAKKANGVDLEFTTDEVERTVLMAFEYFRKT